MSPAPNDSPNPSPPEGEEDEAPPRVRFTRRSALLAGFFILSVVAFLYFVLPEIAGVGETWHRLETGDPWWLAIAAVAEAVSYFGHIWLFRIAFVREGTRITWRESYEVTMAGVAATRLFSAAGAGGLALTAWAMRRWGLDRRVVAARLVAFLCLLYSVYDLALIVGGLGLYVGLFPGNAPFAMTVLPAILAAVVLGMTLAFGLVPGDIESRLVRWADGHGVAHRLLARLSTVPASAGVGVRMAIEIARRREAGLMGSVVWWGADVATLWACFHAFGGDQPTIAVIVVAYFVGMIGNTLPLPGGVGGVEGGMIGAFAAFGVDFSYATVAVLAYRAFSFWLPTLPGTIAYFQLRGTVARWGQERRARHAADGGPATATV
ncbi:MAG TPA: lysylphosphatidylglycerol synthase transmembrane domain-containing protein [Solirubrobacteraceae bacterium]|nr:lysylphosphatidylglycerol synthase transmembrane domain-containing protein [Solirubrobacteraceae bacterium]